MTRHRLIKDIAIVLCLLILTTGCGGSGSGNNGTGGADAAPAQTDIANESKEEDIKEEKDTADSSADQNPSSEKSDNKQTEPAAKLSTNTTIEETVLFEDEIVRVTALSLEFKYNTPYLNLKFENNGDKALSFVAGSMGYSCNSINGYMVDGLYVNVDVEPGKTALEDAYVDADLLTMYGIDKIAEIGIGFTISDNDYNEYAKTGPLYVKTSDAEGYDAATDIYLNAIQSNAIKSKYSYSVEIISQDDFLEQEELKGLSACILTNKDGERNLFLEIENTSDEDLNVSSEHISINGVVLVSTTWSADSINSGKKRVVSISLDDIARHAGGKLEELGLADIANIGMYLNCYDMNSNDVFSKEAEFALSGTESAISFDGEEVYNENDIRISGGKIIKDDYGYAHMVLLVENNSSKEIDLDEDYGSFSVNGIMADCIVYSLMLEPGEKGIMDVQMSKYDLQDINIADPDEITEAELKFRIRDVNYNDIDTATVKLDFTQK